MEYIKMNTNDFFSARYKDILSENGFCENIEVEKQYLLTSAMIWFAAPISYEPNRYDTYTINTDALTEAINVFSSYQGWGERPDTVSNEEILNKRDLHELFDIIEIQYGELGAESNEYQAEINSVFSRIDSPFRMLNGRIIKIDAQQFEQDLKNKALEMIKHLHCENPLFQSVYDELLQAYEKYELGDYKDCILKAEYSFESMMKLLLDDSKFSTAAANPLVEAITASDYFSNIPEDALGIMKDKVLLSLPTLRNKCGSGHGQGSSASIIPKSVANLALNLASTLNTFLADLYVEKNFTGQHDEYPIKEELPF